MPAIGIDLGTTYCSIAVFRHGHLELIPSAEGFRTTPSYVAFGPAGRFFGYEAKKYLRENPSHTVYDSKSLIGRQINDPHVCVGLDRWPFKIVDIQGKPCISINNKTYSAEEISGMIIKNLIQGAEDYLNERITNIVLSIPAYFNNNQRLATMRAGELAGVQVLQLLHEPTAAAIAYAYDLQPDQKRRLVLVYDLGGGTFDVTIMEIVDRKYTVLAVNGDTTLGGQDIDSRLLSYCLRKYGTKTTPTDVQRLKHECEEAKCRLSGVEKTKITLTNLFNQNITRREVEKLMKDLINRTLELVTQALKDAGVERKDIDELLLVGGSTKIPKIRKSLKKYFKCQSIPIQIIDPDEQVAMGCAILAANCYESIRSHRLRHFVLREVIPLSLGIGVRGDIVKVVIPRNTLIPVENSIMTYTSRDNQPFTFIPVYEGERLMEKDNNLLGNFIIRGYPLAPQGYVKIEVIFRLDASGCLTVLAYEVEGEARAQLVVERNQARSARPYVNRMIVGAEKHEKEDAANLQRYRQWKKAQAYAAKLKQVVQNAGSSARHEDLAKQCDQLILWFFVNPTATESEWGPKLNQLQKDCTAVLE